MPPSGPILLLLKHQAQELFSETGAFSIAGNYVRDKNRGRKHAQLT
jgi:hypothetical protein